MAANSWYVDGGAFLTVAQYLATGPPNLTSDGYRNLQVDAAGNLKVNVVVGGGGGGGTASSVTINDPTTITNQAAVLVPGGSGTYALSVQGVTGGTPQPVSISGTVPVTGTFWQATQPVSAATLPLPTGAATSANQPNFGVAGTPATNVLTVQGSPSGTAQPISATTLPLPTGAATSALQPSLGTAGSPSSNVITVQGIGSGTAQPISAAALPLPAGAATSALQPTLGTAGVASSNVLTVQGIASMTALKVDGSAVTQPISIASMPALVAGSAAIGQVGGKTTKVAVTPTITSGSSYTPAGLEIGGLMTFSNALLTAGSGILESIYIQCKSKQTTSLALAIFDTNPTNSTWANAGTPAIAAGDIPFLIGIYTLATPLSSLGTHTIWNLNGIQQVLKPGTTTLYGVLISLGVQTFSSTTDLTVVLGILAD